ncbi:MAG: hypothetical protein JNJ85_07185 [Candidatus Kapabacteria bacterium]|nr:hypothetical protein [Candidatus Kapabacteria bacterium]
MLFIKYSKEKKAEMVVDCSFPQYGALGKNYRPVRSGDSNSYLQLNY